MITTIGMALVAMGTSGLFVRSTVFSGNQLRRMRSRARARMHPGPGFARHDEITLHMGRTAAVWHGRRSRRDLSSWERMTSGAHHYSVRVGRGPAFRRIYVPGEDQVGIIAVQRMGKTGYLADRIYDHPGACVAVSTRHDLHALTSARRAQLGPVLVFNPQNVGNVPSNFRMDVVADCIDPDIAQKTAAALCGPVDAGTDNAMWEALACSALAGLLHAAAVLGRDMSAVWSWANRIGEGEVVEAMNKPGAFPDRIAAALAIQRDSKTADSIRTILTRSLTWVASPQLRDMVTGFGLDSFDADEFLASKGTIYLINSGSDVSAEPLFRLITEKIYDECRLAGTRTAYGRIANPLLMALDEVTTTAAVPLADWLSTGAGDGIQICYIVHTPARLRARYGKDTADAIWQLTATKIILGGNSDAQLAKDLIEITGHYQDEDGKERPKIPADFLRQLPGLRAVVVAKERSPIVVKIRPIWKRPGQRKTLRPMVKRLGLADTRNRRNRGLDLGHVLPLPDVQDRELETVA